MTVSPWRCSMMKAGRMRVRGAGCMAFHRLFTSSRMARMLAAESTSV